MPSRSRSWRRLIPAGLLLAGVLAAAAPATGQTPGDTTTSTTTPTTTTTTTTTPGIPGAPSGQPAAALAAILPGGIASVPDGAPWQVARAITAANKIHTRTYIWGGGHHSFKARGYDCSGAVSFVLHKAGLLSTPLVSGQLASWGTYGPGTWITVYANRVHTYMVIAGLRYDTSPLGEWINQGRGPRWRYTLRTGLGFAVRHYPGL